MTKDTKIALLVALGFLIVIGILLSDHIQTTTLPTPAQLTNAGESVRTSTQTPGVAELPVKLAAPATVVPVAVVPIGGDLSRQEQRQDKREDQWAREQSARQQQPIIHIGGPATGSGAEQVQTVSHETFSTGTTATPNPLPSTPSVSATTEAAQPANPFDPIVREVIPPNASGPVVTQAHLPPIIDPVAARKQQIRELVGSNSPSLSPVTPSPASASATFSSYKAREGDTLGRMAQKALGANTKANRDAIARLNPSLQARPDVIVAGRDYKVPATAAGAVATTPAPAISNGGSTTWYTVREGDSLWKIAKREVGDAGAVNQIIALNRNSLKDGSNLQPDMKLRLPAKGDGGAVAGAND